MHLRVLASSVLQVLGMVYACSACSLNSAREPNVIIVVIDTLRADRLQQYGYELPTAPGLEWVAARSTRYDNAFAPSTWTVPSTASLLSGVWPAKHGVHDRKLKLAESFPTVAEVLRDRGWQTAAFSHNAHISPGAGYDQGFDVFRGHQGGPVGYLDVSKLLPEVRAWHEQLDPQRPFFLYLQAMNCHGPYRVPRPERSELLGREPDTSYQYRDQLHDGIMWQQKTHLRDKVSGSIQRSLTEKYDTAVRYTTDQLGELLAELGEDVLENSLIVITADHGEELFDREGFGHVHSMFNEVLRVPLFVHLPGQSAAGRSGQVVSLLDVFPTILNELGIPTPGDLHGQPLPAASNPLAEGMPSVQRSDAESGTLGRELLIDVRWPNYVVGRGLIRGNMKFVFLAVDYDGSGSKTFLFDLEQDPGERHNLAQERPEQVKDMRRRMRELIDELESESGPAPTREGGDLTDETLRALGYIE